MATPNKPLVIRYQGGYSKSFQLDEAEITGDAIVDSASDYLQSLNSGCLLTVDDNGNAILASDATVAFAVIQVPASGYAFENLPAAASAKVTGLVGRNEVIISNPVETNIVPGEALYVSADGRFTTVESTTKQVVGYALSKNSVDNPSVIVQTNL